MTWLGIFENIIASVIFFFITPVVGYFWVVFSRRQRLHKFFGVKGSKRLILYLSNIRVDRFGSIGVSGEKYSYNGFAIAYGEMLGANQLRELQSFLIPSAANSEDVFKNFLVVDVKAQIQISPLEEREIEKDSPIISLGSPAYNCASGYIENLKPYSAKIRSGYLIDSDLDNNSHFSSFTSQTITSASSVSAGGNADAFQNNPSDENLSSPTKKKLIPSAIIVNGLPEITDVSYSFVQRIFDAESNQFLFYVAGLSELSTTGAAFYLKSEWNHLYKKYSTNKEFIVLLQFKNSDYTHWTVIFDRIIK